MNRTRSLFACAACTALLAVGACASGGGVAQSGNGTASPQVRRNPNVITQQELEQSGETNLHSAIARLRPAFLSTRGVSTVSGGDQGVMVYVDGTKYGDVSSLDNLQVDDVKQIEFLNSGEATQRFGTGNTHGVILITRK